MCVCVHVCVYVHSKNRCVKLHTKVCFNTHLGVFQYTPRCVKLTHLFIHFTKHILVC
jgi:hypothetical protein